MHKQGVIFCRGYTFLQGIHYLARGYTILQRGFTILQGDTLFCRGYKILQAPFLRDALFCATPVNPDHIDYGFQPIRVTIFHLLFKLIFLNPATSNFG